jgi:hypothetical protein
MAKGPGEKFCSMTPAGQHVSSKLIAVIDKREGSYVRVLDPGAISDGVSHLNDLGVKRTTSNPCSNSMPYMP